MTLSAPLTLGELIDRLTILEIKAQRIASPTKRAHVRRELAGLEAIAAPYIAKNAAVVMLKRRLKAVNSVLWSCEEASRQRFRRAPQTPAKAAALLSRIALNNDRRHRLKQRISRLAKGGLVEQKSYYS
ncbi:MAG: hypothetical protein DCF16_01110 [Alphaproteobacteria bacterium]|nr:MAG: hypothetical protein DCF16_01110 [Alphaproteobacteria bacterium]